MVGERVGVRKGEEVGWRSRVRVGETGGSGWEVGESWDVGSLGRLGWEERDVGGRRDVGESWDMVGEPGRELWEERERCGRESLDMGGWVAWAGTLVDGIG